MKLYLGEIVFVITKYTGIRWIVKKVTKLLGKDDCGCDKRRKKWNDIEIKRLDKWIK